jgi:glycosyltransferase involved in cell wall biosynthesis
LSFAGRKQNPNDRVVPLTLPQQSVDGDAHQAASDFWQQKGVSAERTKVVFIGTHSVAFDMAPVVNAARYFADKENDVDFVICGEGPMIGQWKQAFGNAANVYFPGWIDSAQIEVLLASSVAVLAPYFSTENFTTNVPNKVVDGLSHGKPILTGLKGEVEALVKGHQVGLFYGDDERSLEQCIEVLLGDALLLSNIETNAFNLYQDQFEFNNVYKGLVAHLEELATAEVLIK